ncbi:tubulin binding cofactor c, putative [Plasmodium gallinaceum]|uniref:Tubulin binding cofactor c, putative n=1 Tax=Plasmodium gallinaceum TaxID=5849 RepID=A0A1J1GP01_PLAGA|nr:tubulin binding cofactor c, putative [Plasmodium gallinaceum]CRG94215.1 tubulin binding cofactor c, putative [Plasmodium gallinaceum]
MDEELTNNEHIDHDEIILKNIKDIETKIQKLKKNIESNDNKLIEINELNDRTIKLKERLTNIYFQFLKHSSVIIYEKKLKELIKEIESLKYILIQNRNKIEYNDMNINYDDSFFLPENDSIDEEYESKELVDYQIDINQYKLSFQNISNKRIIKGFGETEYSSLLLDNLENCEIIVLDILSSVLIQKIQKCTIWVAAVESSVLIYNCVNCTILTNTKQIRIHDTNDTNFYINTMSSPIIENSKNLSFLQYNFNYDSLSELLKKINIDKNSSKWREVLDFNWQNTEEKSPHFSIIDETQEFHINIKKNLGENKGNITNNSYIIENFPSFLKRVD